ncbi:MAG: carbon storage regulator [Sulfurimonas sp.]|jgi:carbon storage regulator CsrA|nr:carbon storage regulator [Sulfurimonas sp.]
MLVLARKEGESIVIGEDIILKVISVDKGVVKLGIEAPSDVAIIRNELLQDVKDSNIAASKKVGLESLSLLSKILKK